MKMKYLLLTLIITTSCTLFAQNDNGKRMKQLQEATKVEANEGWKVIGGLGLDMGQFLIVNPYIGAGQNRLGLGGAFNFVANYKKGLLTWDNNLGINLAIQKLGAGVIAQGSTLKVPFEKSLDLLTLGSNLAYKMNAKSKWAYSFNFFGLSQLAPSYQAENGKYYLSKIDQPELATTLRSKLLSPAEFTFSLGMKYQYSKQLSIFISPLSSKIFYVADASIAAIEMSGQNVWGLDPGAQSRFEMGANLRADYTTKIKEKISWTSGLSLYSNYLKSPQNIDVIWLNSFGFELFKNLKLELQGNLFYDHDKLTQITDYNAVGGVNGVGRRVSFYQQLLITYQHVF